MSSPTRAIIASPLAHRRGRIPPAAKSIPSGSYSEALGLHVVGVDNHLRNKASTVPVSLRASKLAMNDKHKNDAFLVSRKTTESGRIDKNVVPSTQLWFVYRKIATLVNCIHLSSEQNKKKHSKPFSRPHVHRSWRLDSKLFVVSQDSSIVRVFAFLQYYLTLKMTFISHLSKFF